MDEGGLFDVVAESAGEFADGVHGASFSEPGGEFAEFSVAEIEEEVGHALGGIIGQAAEDIFAGIEIVVDPEVAVVELLGGEVLGLKDDVGGIVVGGVVVDDAVFGG